MKNKALLLNPLNPITDKIGTIVWCNYGNPGLCLHEDA